MVLLECMVCRGPQAVMDEMDVTEPKETEEVQEGLDLGDQKVKKERKEKRENLVSRALLARKEREGRKVTVEFQEHLSFLRT